MDYRQEDHKGEFSLIAKNYRDPGSIVRKPYCTDEREAFGKATKCAVRDLSKPQMSRPTGDYYTDLGRRARSLIPTTTCLGEGKG